MPVLHQGSSQKSLSRSPNNMPNRKKSVFNPHARRQPEIKDNLNQDLQIHQRNEKITSNEDIRQEMSLAQPDRRDRTPVGNARNSKQAIQQILNNKSQQNAGIHLLNNSANVRITVNQRRQQPHAKGRPQYLQNAPPMSKKYSLQPSITNDKTIDKHDQHPAAQQQHQAVGEPKKQMNLTNQLSTFSNLPSYQIKED